MWFYNAVMCPKDADRMANSVHTDQTGPLVADWFGSTHVLFRFHKMWSSDNDKPVYLRWKTECFDIIVVTCFHYSSTERSSSKGYVPVVMYIRCTDAARSCCRGVSVWGCYGGTGHPVYCTILPLLLQVRVLTLKCLVDSSILTNWTRPFQILGISGVRFFVFVFRICIPVSKQSWPWSDRGLDAAFCGIWPVSTLFAKVSFMGR